MQYNDPQEIRRARSSTFSLRFQRTVIYGSERLFGSAGRFIQPFASCRYACYRSGDAHARSKNVLLLQYLTVLNGLMS